MNNQFLNLAINKAKKSISKHKVSAIAFDKKGDMLGCISNSPRFSREGGGNHAEMRLIRRYGRNIRTVILVRVNSKGDLLPINPCKTCGKVLKELDIKVRSIK